jgi:hypothetical protein
MAIDPLNLPSGAGINFGEGDVRHFSEGDGVSVPGLANPTRQLAERDNRIGAKVNEIIQIVNNKEQFVPLPVIRTTVPPNETVIVTNYRIPAGFEARVLNAAVSSLPLSANIELNVYYAEGFGNSTGEVLVTTSDEAEANTSFQNNGEFIVSLVNKGGTTLEIMASILLTMRPIGEEGSLLVGSVVRGDTGPVGMTGPQGPAGPPGTGGAGSPGMLWDGEWVDGKGYTPKTVVSFPLFGTVISSYFCRVAHTADTSNQPPNADYWDTVALGSAGSVVGAQGPAGPAGGIPTYSAAIISGTGVPDGDYVGGTSDQGYSGGGAAYGTLVQQFNQYYIDSGTGSVQGLAFLTATFRRVYSGNVKVFLPQISPEGAVCDWNTTNVLCQASINGSYGIDSNPVNTVQVRAISSSQYDIKVNAATPQKVSFTFVGVQPIL